VDPALFEECQVFGVVQVALGIQIAVADFNGMIKIE
jgi:hypothetical protein